MLSEKFENYYRALNDRQKRAVDAIEGPVMVIAGPGTGKTQVLTLRIANILTKTDTPPDGILALTFTESGVYSMRKRLVEIVGSTAYKINLFTFHSFCNEVINSYPDNFPRIIGSEPITEADQVKIVEEIIETAKLTELRPYGDSFYYLRPTLSTIKTLKRENIDPTAFADLVEKQYVEFENAPDKIHVKGAHKGKMKGEFLEKQKRIAKNRELAMIFSLYQEKLAAKKLYDFEDMIMEVVRTMEKNHELLLTLQEKYLYILADEHQDANNAQNRLLELLSNFHSEPNLFIVGDEKQAIFRFQGASLENFLYFRDLYPSAKVITLDKNYRSVQSVLDAAHSLIGHAEGVEEDLRVKLISEVTFKPDHPIITLYDFSLPEKELSAVASLIAQNIASGTSAGEIAVIYRDNNDSGPIARALEERGIRYNITSEQDLLAQAEIRKFITLLKAIHNPADGFTLGSSLYLDFLGLDPLDAHRIVHFASANRKDIARVLNSADMLAEAGVADTEKVKQWYEKFRGWVSYAKNASLIKTLDRIMDESGFLASLSKKPEAYSLFEKVDGLLAYAAGITQAHKDAVLTNLMDALAVFENYKLPIKTFGAGEDGERVKLMTAHKSKGLEFEYVYIIGAYEGHWGGRSSRKYFHIPQKDADDGADNSLNDERRLFYVALTRAKKGVTISYSRRATDGKERLASPLVEEIDKSLIHAGSAAALEERLAADRFVAFSATKIKDTVPDITHKHFLNQLFLKQGLSVTALNAYLKCPWKYFFENLVRLPHLPEKHQLYGIAIHAALKEYFSWFSRGEDIPWQKVAEIFERNLSLQPLPLNDFEESLKKGKKSLKGYLEAGKDRFARNLLTELSIAGVFVPIVMENEDGTEDVTEVPIMLRGILDKVEFVTATQVNVIDYKTGKSKSRNDILGKTVSSDGNYYRQLLFYKILLDRHGAEEGRTRPYDMVSASIEFIEPDEKGRYHNEQFEITTEDTAPVIEQIIQTSKDILSLSFWNKTCDDPACEFCRLRKILL